MYPGMSTATLAGLGAIEAGTSATPPAGAPEGGMSVGDFSIDDPDGDHVAQGVAPSYAREPAPFSSPLPPGVNASGTFAPGPPPMPSSYEGASLLDGVVKPVQPPPKGPDAVPYEGATLFDVKPSLAAPTIQPAAAPIDRKVAAEMSKLADSSYDAREHARSILHGVPYANLADIKGATALGNNVDLSGVRKPATAVEAAQNAIAAANSRKAAPGVSGGSVHQLLSRSAPPGNRPAVEEAIHALTAARDLEAASADQAYQVAEKMEPIYYGAAMAKVGADERMRIALEQKSREQAAYAQADNENLEALNERATKEIDPEAYWKDKGAFAKVLAGIAIGLGQFGALMRGGRNNAWDIIQSGVDANIRAQETSASHASKAFDARANLFARNMAAFGDRERAILATRMQTYAAVDSLVDEKMAENKGLLDVSAYNQIKAQLERLHAADAAAWTKETTNRAAEIVTYTPAQKADGATPTSLEAKSDARYLSEAYEKAGIPQALSELQDIDQRLDTMGTGDIAGVGLVKEHLPSWVLSTEGVANQQAIARIKGSARASIAGASLTDAKKAELQEQLEGAHDADSVRNVIQSFRRSLMNQQKNIEAGAGHEGSELYKERGGSVTDVSLSKPTTPTLKPVEK